MSNDEEDRERLIAELCKWSATITDSLSLRVILEALTTLEEWPDDWTISPNAYLDRGLLIVPLHCGSIVSFAKYDPDSHALVSWPKRVPESMQTLVSMWIANRLGGTDG